jgi:hypothetical protein
VFQVGLDNVGPTFYNVLHDPILIIGFCFPGFNLNGALGAGTDAGSQTITEKVTYKVGLAVNYLQGTFRASRDAVPTAGALFLVNFYNISFLTYFSLYFLIL